MLAKSTVGQNTVSALMTSANLHRTYQTHLMTRRRLLSCAVFRSVRSSETVVEANDPLLWTHLFKTTVSLVRHLYTRDTRRQVSDLYYKYDDRK